MPMPRLRTGGAEAAVSEAFGGGGRWVEAGGAPDDAVTVPTAQGRLHAGDTLVCEQDWGR